MSPAAAVPALPHGGGMRLVERILEVDEEGIVCVGRVRTGTPLAGTGAAAAFAGVEMAAQAVAAHAAHAAGGGGSAPGIGYLVRVRGVTLGAQRLPLDRDIRVRARRAGGAPPLAAYDVSLEADGQVALEGSLTTYAAP